MRDSSSAFDSLLHYVFRPRLLLQGLMQYAIDWLYTRHWGGVFPLVPVLVLLVVGLSLVTYGNWMSQKELVIQYIDLASAEVEGLKDDSLNGGQGDVNVPEQSESQGGEDDLAGQSASSKVELLKEEEVSDFGELLLRRILQLESSNPRAKYLVASKIAQSGRMGQARGMLRDLAPEMEKGFPPAHAWLAYDRLRRGDFKNPQEITTLLNDLAIACQWRGTGPQMIAIYAELLEKNDNVNEALSVLSQAAPGNPQIQLLLVDMARRHGRRKTFDEVSQASKDRLQERFDSGNPTVEDYVNMGNLLLLEGKAVEGRELVLSGLRMDPENETLRRLLSEAYRLEYRASLNLSGNKAQLNFGLLDAALKSDPANPRVGEEIAILLAMGKNASKELESALETQLANGQATALTHILLAEQKLRSGQVDAAIPHLELALLQAPGNPTALNNLALALARTDKGQFARALQLSQQAVALAPSVAEYVDTQGEIRSLMGDHTGAIECYERAIGMDESRTATRRSLAEVYRAIGLPDMAELQLKKIQELNNSPPKTEAGRDAP